MCKKDCAIKNLFAVATFIQYMAMPFNNKACAKKYGDVIMTSFVGTVVKPGVTSMQLKYQTGF